MEILEEENFDDDEGLENESKESVTHEKEENEYDYGEHQEDPEDFVPADIDEETLKQIERDFCLIRLTWPEIDLGDTWAAQLPPSYRTVSDKEKNLLYHAEHFRKQYHTIYPDRKPLLLACDNECGVQKLVSTSIRPSTLLYPELYTWQGCANFVSDHLEYEPPERPLNMPVILRSPTWSMTFQRGNDFEYATLLVSLLLGKGYNAFVVSGYASREQVFCDTRMQTCPYLKEDKKPPTVSEQIDTPKYKLKDPPDFRSQLMIELEAREAKKIQEELEKLEEERAKMLLEQERPLPDDFWGNRIHAWVLVLPEIDGPRKDEIEKAFFIEPTSGFSYFPDKPETKLLYHGVESVWNDKNYWINMQTCENGCFDLDWDLSNVNNWERLLPGESGLMPRVNEDEDLDEDINLQQEKHLEMPFSYVENIEIDSLDFERRYPNGTKTTYFKKTRVDFYAPYVQMDGLVRKITIYEDYDYKLPIQVEEKYSNRADMLVESKKYIDACNAVDFYKRGRPDACIEHRYSTNGSDRIDEERTLNFFHSIRPDGLSKIEMDPFHLTQHYIGRKDLLYYRHVEYSKDEEGGPRDRIVSRIIEKYNRNENILASKDVAIRDFFIAKKEIRLHYHYEKNRVTRAMKRFIKPSTSESGERPVFNPDLIQGYNPDPLAPPEKQLSIYYELQKQLKEESECLILVRDAEIEIITFLRKKSSEYIMPKLLVSLFDRNRNEEAKAEMLAQEQLLKAQSEKEVEVEVDYLGPYLARLGNPPELTRAQAAYVRNECLNDLKKLFVDRANNMLRMLDECTKELNQVQNWLTQSEGKTREEEEELLNLTNDINFHLHTLDVRLQRHCELAPERYRKMLMTLKADERLAAFFD